MDQPKNLSEFRQEFGRMPRAAFLARFYDPFLLVSMSVPVSGPGSLQDEEQKSPSKSTIADLKQRKTTVVITKVMPLVQRNTGESEGTLTVGRAEDNDVVVPHRCVSRHHAALEVDVSSDAFTVSDVGSSYGSVVDGEPLTKGVKKTIQSGSTVVLGQVVQCVLLTPEHLYNYLRTLGQI
ncbi:MAG: FHA domain-containing protein [Planctomycetota bacterium]